MKVPIGSLHLVQSKNLCDYSQNKKFKGVMKMETLDLNWWMDTRQMVKKEFRLFCSKLVYSYFKESWRYSDWFISNYM